MRTKKIQFFLVAFTFILILAYLIGAGVKKSWVYYFTVDELVAKQNLVGKTIKVSGKVATGSIERNYKVIHFTIYENGAQLKVNYQGFLPDAFGEETPVVAEGVYTGQTLEAKEILTKCPSKYEAKESQK